MLAGNTLVKALEEHLLLQEGAVQIELRLSFFPENIDEALRILG
jgi:hypothetical protein